MGAKRAGAAQLKASYRAQFKTAAIAACRNATSVDLVLLNDGANRKETVVPKTTTKRRLCEKCLENLERPFPHAHARALVCVFSRRCSPSTAT